MTPTDELNIFMAGENRRYLLATPLRDAAPDLLEACKFAAMHLALPYPEEEPHERARLISELKATIAKAQGDGNE